MTEPTERPSIFERNPRKTLFVVLVVVFIGLDVAAAYAARLVLGYPLHNRPGEDQYMLDNPNKRYRAKSDIYHHGLKPSVSSDGATWGGWSYSVHTDSLGFKSDQVKTTPTAGTGRRIVFIGDSFTEGVGFEHAETFVGKITAALSEKGVDVFNAGVSSYSPIIYWRKTKHLLEDVGLQFTDLVVFLDISDIEDEARFYRLTEKGTVERLKQKRSKPRPNARDRSEFSFKRLLRNGTVLTYFIINATHDAFYGKDDSKQLATGRDRARWTLDETLFEAYGREGLERAAQNMQRLYDLLSTHGIRLTVAVYPWPDQIVSNDLDSIQVSYWKKWTAERGIRFMDYFPCFVKRDGGDAVIEKYFVPGDVHWNEPGHELVAETFLRFDEAGGRDEACCCK